MLNDCEYEAKINVDTENVGERQIRKRIGENATRDEKYKTEDKSGRKDEKK